MCHNVSKQRQMGVDKLGRYMVDGMGTAGTQGVFQRCAEETLLLRAPSSTTDPPGSQALTPGHGGVPPLDMSSGTAEEAADRALTTMGRKLDGALSTECTVNELIIP